MMDIKEALLLWFMDFLINNLQVCHIKSIPNKQLADQLHKPIIKKIKRKKYILHLKAIFGILILQICN